MRDGSLNSPEQRIRRSIYIWRRLMHEKVDIVLRVLSNPLAATARKRNFLARPRFSRTQKVCDYTASFFEKRTTGGRVLYLHEDLTRYKTCNNRGTIHYLR